jgi:hypothetical protein
MITSQRVIFGDAVWEGDNNNCKLVTKWDDGKEEYKNLTLREAMDWVSKLGK